MFWDGKDEYKSAAFDFNASKNSVGITSIHYTDPGSNINPIRAHFLEPGAKVCA